MDERSSGIILRTRPLTETSLIVLWLTPDLGRLATVAKGARRPKSAFAGKLDLFFEAVFSYQRSRKSELHMLREVVVTTAHPEFRSRLPLLHQAAYFTVLIEQGTERETPIPEIHELLRRYLAALPEVATVPEAMFLFEYHFLRLLGCAPDLDHPLFGREFSQLAPLSSGERNDLNRALRSAIINGLEKLPPQRQRAIESFKTTAPSAGRG